MRRILDIRHHKDDYECMWNGIEDLYLTKTGESIPNGFFFALSGYGNFIYLKSEKNELKRMLFFGDGRTRQMYDRLKDIVGFTYRCTQGKTFADTLEKAKGEIDCGHPVVLGALDMYELPYDPKRYHRAHIPIHYVLMTGYDDERRSVFVLDCGRTELQELSFDALERALDIEPTPMSKSNSICCVRMEHPAGRREIAWNALREKAGLFLHPPISSLGYRGFCRLAAEFPRWREEFSPDDYRKCLMHIAMFTGTVPVLPNRLAGIDAPDEVPHMASRERLSEVLTVLGKEFDRPAMIRSGGILLESGRRIEAFAGIVTDSLAGEGDRCEQAGAILLEAAELEKEAYETLLIALR